MVFSQKWKNRIFILMIIAATGFILLTTIAMFVYAGGTPYNPDFEGYSFFGLFFSDLGRLVAYSGRSNLLSAILLLSALTIFGISFIFFFINLRNYFTETKKERIISFLGTIFAIISGIAIIGAGICFGDVFPEFHKNFSFAAYFFGFFPPLFYAIVIFSNKRYPNRYGGVFLTFAILLFGFMLAFVLGPSYLTPEGLVFQAVGQKLILYAENVCYIIEGYGGWKFSNSL